MEAIINQPTVLNGNNGINALIFGKDLSGQTLSGTYTLIACVGSVTVTSGKFYLYNCSGLIVTNQNNAATVIRDGYAIGDYYFSANENPASKFGGYWEKNDVDGNMYGLAANAQTSVESGVSKNLCSIVIPANTKAVICGIVNSTLSDSTAIMSAELKGDISTVEVRSTMSNGGGLNVVKLVSESSESRTVYLATHNYRSEPTTFNAELTALLTPRFKNAYKRIANPSDSNMQ